jgi:heptosyltransferase-3
MSLKKRILIFQIGSLGDTVISMPCYREIHRRHPDSERYLLTNFPIGKKMVQAEAMLRPCGLINGCVEYPMPLRGLENIRDLYKRLRALGPDVLYYLIPEKSFANLIRHYAFFRACGIRDIRGVPWTRDLRFPREVSSGTLWESEASRLLRTIGAQFDPSAPEPADRSLNLTAEERSSADRLRFEVPEMSRFVAISVGGKVPINDWGNENWASVLAAISATQPGVGAVFIGSADERERNDLLAASWAGPKLNSCGRLTPRETAALIAQAELFLGHDTGTLHLAAAVDTRVIGVFSARNVPGKWYSDRPRDRFFYNKPPCFGCELERAADCPRNVICMKEHSLQAIVDAVGEGLAHA